MLICYYKQLEIMKTILLNQLESLKKALKDGSVSVNEYSTFYYTISQKLKALENENN